MKTWTVPSKALFGSVKKFTVHALTTYKSNNNSKFFTTFKILNEPSLN